MRRRTATSFKARAEHSLRTFSDVIAGLGTFEISPMTLDLELVFTDSERNWRYVHR